MSDSIRPNFELWETSADDYPTSGSLQDKLRFICIYGHLAPSSHNTQPWKFVIVGNTIEIHADYQFKLPVADPTNKELYISCGCTIPNIEIAAKHFGFETKTKLLPKGLKSKHVATISFEVGSKRAQPLFDVLTKRLTNRAMFKKGKPLPQKIKLAYQRQISASPIDLELYEGSILDGLATITKDSMYSALSNPAFRNELSHWVRHNWTKKGDGLPGNTLGMPDSASIMITTLVKSPMMAKTSSEMEEKMVRSSSAIGILFADKESKSNWIHTGMTYSRIALQTQQFKLGIEPLSGSIEMKEQRKQLLEILDEDRTPMMFFRIGYPMKPFPHSPRRQLDEVVS